MGHIITYTNGRAVKAGEIARVPPVEDGEKTLHVSFISKSVIGLGERVRVYLDENGRVVRVDILEDGIL